MKDKSLGTLGDSIVRISAAGSAAPSCEPRDGRGLRRRRQDRHGSIIANIVGGGVGGGV
jgi:hypothetical protein